ncbi:MAG TPA: hypothetical protein VHB46_02070 [Burkholderiales bacterium]|nr:hypothetical protein [Burkholderiales bacterium]
MHRFARTICAGALCAAMFPNFVQAQEKSGAVAAAVIETVVTVVDVDREARVVTVKGPKGRLADISVPPEAQNLDQVHPGSRFSVVYAASVATAISKGSGGATSTSSRSKSVELAPKGAIPGGAIVRTREINAVVDAVDRDNRTMTVTGPERRSIEVQVGESVKDFDQVQAGDVITLQYTEGLALRMIPQ